MEPKRLELSTRNTNQVVARRMDELALATRVGWSRVELYLSFASRSERRNVEAPPGESTKTLAAAQ